MSSLLSSQVTLLLLVVMSFFSSLANASPLPEAEDEPSRPIKYGVTCAPFDWKNPKDNTHWGGAGYLSGKIEKGVLEGHKDIIVRSDPAFTKIGKFMHIYGSPTWYKYTFNARGSFVKRYKMGVISLEAIRSSGKGEGKQFRMSMWNVHKKRLGTWWLTPNVSCLALVDFDPATAHTIGVDARDWNGPAEKEDSHGEN